MIQILIAEDERCIRQVVAYQLRKEGYGVLEASNGADALKVIEANRVDLIISDIVMPELNGYELRKRLLENEKYALVPFIFLTAKTGLDDKIEGLKLDADEYLGKPFQLRELSARIHALLSRQERLNRSIEQEKMETLRETISNICNEMNNPLTVILSYLYMLRGKRESLSPVMASYLDPLLVAAVNMKDFVKNFAKKAQDLEITHSQGLKPQ